MSIISVVTVKNIPKWFHFTASLFVLFSAIVDELHVCVPRFSSFDRKYSEFTFLCEQHSIL